MLTHGRAASTVAAAYEFLERQLGTSREHRPKKPKPAPEPVPAAAPAPRKIAAAPKKNKAAAPRPSSQPTGFARKAGAFLH